MNLHQVQVLSIDTDEIFWVVMNNDTEKIIADNRVTEITKA